MSVFLPTVDLTTRANSSSLTSEIGKVTKKVRTRSELQLDKDDRTIDMNGQEVQGTWIAKVSYKSTLLGESLSERGFYGG